MNKIIKYVMIDLVRNKVMIAYTLVLLMISLSIFNIEDSNAKGLLSLLNVILIIVPLVSLLFATIYVYNSSEFLELLVSQPLKRKTIWLSLFIGLATVIGLAFVIGIGLPILFYELTSVGIMMMITGILLSVIFVALAMVVAVIARDKAKGIGSVILLWLYFSIIFDGIVLFILFQFADYPLEKFMVGLSVLNPIDLSRILILLKLEISALMGYTGAVFNNFFGTSLGLTLSLITLITWAIIPTWISLRKFKSKDL
ncbi:MAG: ABC transporter permease subunit [Chitinophagaceae bacterium]|nr:ABC transporter permease subunit [Chitinophagaceae bacterium]